MAQIIIIAINLTALDIELQALGVVVPGSGTLTLTDYLYDYEIKADIQLKNEVAANRILLDIGGGTLTKDESQQVLINVTTTHPVATVIDLDSYANKILLDSYASVDGDILDIDFVPMYYNRTITPPFSSSNDHLTSHLAGIDAYLGQIELNGVSIAEHNALRQLIHFIDNGPATGFASGAYRETTGTAFPSSIIWYDKVGVGKKKIVSKEISYSGAFPTTITWKVYNSSEVLLNTVTDTITYSGAFESSRTRTII